MMMMKKVQTLVTQMIQMKKSQAVCDKSFEQECAAKLLLQRGTLLFGSVIYLVFVSLIVFYLNCEALVFWFENDCHVETR